MDGDINPLMVLVVVVVPVVLDHKDLMDLVVE
jgi:hypothetical protein